MNQTKTLQAPYAFAPEMTDVIYFERPPGYSAARQATEVMARDSVEITWVRACRATIILLFKGQTLKKLTDWNDWYGFMSCLDDLVEETAEEMENWGIEPTSEVELAVIAYLEDTPTLGLSHTEYNRHHYHQIDRATLLHFSEAAKLGEKLTEANFPYADRKWLCSEIKHGYTKVWSSQLAPIENEKRLEHFKALANAEKRKLLDNENVDIHD